MFETRDDMLDRLIRRVRLPVQLDAALDARIMARIVRSAPARPGPLGAVWRWLVRPRAVNVSPLAALGAVVAVVAVVAVSRMQSAGSLGEAEPHVRPVQFALVARQASSVVLVGDFNDWDPTHTPMEPAGIRGVWAATVPLMAGRHRYAFLVDGALWVTDPAAPSVPDDDFGTPSSVLTVGGS